MKRFVIFLLVLLMLPVHVCAEEAPTGIYTVEELLAVAENPSGSYILMEDLDMTGVVWESPDFSGSFDGNGHAILNLTLTQPGGTLAKTYDGNLKTYDTACAGLFAAMKNAQVANLRLLNVRGVIESDVPAFLGGIAGYMEGSVIENCEITGTLELRAHDRMFGIGGAVGYGSGTVSACDLDMTLICVDTDAETKDEQFLGGVYAGGYIHVTDCRVSLDAYISEHGYVHSGGITGMFLRYPDSTGDTARFQNNHVEGAITFFENNPDRRAYCEPFLGEILVYTAFFFDGNTHDFQKNEVTDYTAELRPEMCENPVYTETVTAGGCDSFGFTTYCCEGCGCTYTDRYTLPQHTRTQWVVIKEATEEAEGLSESACDLCGERSRKVLDKLPPMPTETDPPATEVPPEESATEPAPAPGESGQQETGGPLKLVPAIALGAVVLMVTILCITLKHPKQQGKFQRK